jgi:thioredoxin 1
MPVPNRRPGAWNSGASVQAKLMQGGIWMASEMEFTDSNFDQEVLKSNEPVLVDFWAPWCGPCKMIAPIVAEISTEYAGKLKVGKLNTDDNQGTASRYGVMSIPTVMIFKNGQMVARIVGAQSKQTFTGKIDAVLTG